MHLPRFLFSGLLTVTMLLAAGPAHATLFLETLTPTFSGAVFATSPPGDSERLFVVEQAGRIRILNLASNTVNATAFLDIDPLVLSGGERGLLGLAFSPDYASNGQFFVNYTNNSGNTVIARYTVSANPAVADPASALILKTWTQPYSNHNGGWIGFGPDGMLYTGTGDGGSANDPGARAQNLNSPMGKMMRLDPAGQANAWIPADNPYVGVTGLDEIWAYGLRNPWRCSFDRLTGELWIADVGQNAWEEIDLQPAGSTGGENYGWSCREGLVCTGLNTCGSCSGFSSVAPVHVYNHAGGRCSVTGGYVYRGPIPSLQGLYFFADYCSRQVWSLEWNGVSASVTERTAELGPSSNIVSFGEDEVGNVYIITPSRLYRIASDECGNGSDCNSNGISDDCDIASGFSQDCDANGVPDECDIDCNGNGLPDSCDLINGTSEDCNANGIPDECDIASGFSLDEDLDGVPDECPDTGGNPCDDPLEAVDGVLVFDTTPATTDGPAHFACGGDGQIHRDFWFRYTATLTGTLTISLCGSSIDTRLAVYEGTDCPVNETRLLGCDDNGCALPGSDASALAVDILQGTQYLIRVGGSDPSQAGPVVMGLYSTGTVGCGNGLDCNANGSWDDCDIENGSSQDCNDNGVPDECDIGTGSSLDQNANGVPDECEQTGNWESEHFVSATACAQCHSSGAGIYDEGGQDSSPYARWQGTLMANAARDPYWRAKVRVETEQFSDPGVREAIESACVRCHAPMGSEEQRIAGEGFYRMAEVSGDPAGLEGVSCTLCHQLEASDASDSTRWNGGFRANPDKRIFGPFAGVDPAPMANVTGFSPEQGAHLGDNGTCVSCHTLFTTALDAGGNAIGQFPEQVPWLEQQNSQFAGLSCRGCHMPLLEGAAPISVIPGGLPPRAPRQDHAVLGGNALMLHLLADNADALGTLGDSTSLEQMAQASEVFLQGAASLDAGLSQVGQTLELAVEVRNLTAHKLPTGIPVRRMWLEVIARDAQGVELFHSGAWDANGHILGEDAGVEAHHTTIDDPARVQIWEARMADDGGQPTFSLMRALGWAKDNRLPPAGFVATGPFYEITAPVGQCTSDADFNAGGSGADSLRYLLPAGTRSVELSLNFQGVSPRAIDSMRGSTHPEVQFFLAMWDQADRSPDPIATLSLAWPPLPELEVALQASQVVLSWLDGGSFIIERRAENGQWLSLGTHGSPFVDTGAVATWHLAEYRLRQP